MTRTVAKRFQPIVMLFIILVAGLALGGTVLAAEGINPPVRKIEVLGNKMIATDQIMAVITRTKLGLPVAEEAVKNDLQAIAELGYFYDVRANFREFQDGVKVIFEVAENPKVKEIVISGNSALPSERLRELIPVQDGEILNINVLNKGLQDMLESTFKEFGVPARISDVRIDDSGSIQIKMAETRVNQVIIEGNEKTKDYVIRRELRLKPGQALNIIELHKDLRNILNLGFFDDVSREFKETNDPDVVDLVIKVKERRTGTAGIGAGYSSKDGLLGYIEVTEDNFLGKGQRTNFKWEFGKTKNLYRVGFYEPYISEKTSGGFNIYNERTKEGSDESAYNKTETGIDATLGRKLGEDLRGYFKLRIYDTSLDYEDEAITDEQEKTRSMTFSLVKDTRDFFLRPSSGSRREIAVEVAPDWLGSTAPFNRYLVDYSKYFKIGSGGQVLALHGRSGYLHSTGETGNLLDSELFKVGGPDTVRGYNYSTFKGETLLVLNAEYRFRITDNLDGVLFYDLGNAWAQPDTLKFSDMHQGYGLGVRIDTPVGVMRIDYGIGEEGGKTYFSLGQTF